TSMCTARTMTTKTTTAIAMYPNIGPPDSDPNRSCLRSVRRSDPARQRGGFGATAYAEFGEDIGHVHAHSFFADIELAGDLAVCPAFDELVQDFGFARSQRLGAARRRWLTGTAEVERPDLAEQRFGVQPGGDSCG